MIRLTLILFLFGFQLCGYAQTFRYVVVNNGFWSSASTWNTEANGSGASGVPAAGDYVRTNGNTVIVDSDVTIRRLFVAADVTNSIIYDVNAFDPFTLTVSEFITGYDFASSPTGGAKKPTVAVIGNNNDLTFKFTGTSFSSGTANVIRGWSVSAPFNNVVIDPTGGTVTTLETQAFSSGQTGGEFLVRNTLLISAGIFKPNANIGQLGSATITVSTGTLLDLSAGNINGDAVTNTSKLNNIVVSGTVTTTNTNFFNTDNITLNSSGVININSSGANQTQGWWYQSTAPTGTITLNGLINYGASANQSIYTLSYGDLACGGAGTKTVTATGSVNISKNFTFSGTGITFNSSQLVSFNGTGNQSISGGGTANFDGGLQINKSLGTLVLSQNISIQNGLTISSGTLDLGSNNVNLSGNLSVSGSLVASNSTLTITGATSITSGSPSLNNLTISGTGSFTAPSALSIAGNLSNSGSFNSNNGTETQRLRF